MRLIVSALRGADRFPWTEVPTEFAARIAIATGLVQPGASNLAFQVLIAQWNVGDPPTKEACRTLFKAYRGRQAFPLVVALVAPSGSTYCFGPSEDGIVEGPFQEEQIARILAAAMSETNPALARSLVVHYFDSLHTSAMPGITNTGLFASYYLRESAPKRDDFEALKSRAPALIAERGEGLIRVLGFRAHAESSTTTILANERDVNRAVAVFLERSESFAESSPRFLTSPVAAGLAVAQAREIPWLIALRGSQIRLYSAKVTEGVGRKGQAETYLEVDLAVIEDHYAPLVPLVFAADALAPGGSTEQLLKESARYAVGLGERLRERVYQEVVPRLSVAIAKELQNQGIPLDQAGLDLAYSATLRVLFRLLFQAYAEDRGLLPYAKNDVYDRHAIKTIAQEFLNQASETSQSDSYWRDLESAWGVINKGDHSWGVPAYNGGLFSSTDPEGAALAQISLPNRELVPCLRSLLLDISEDGTIGPVDFRSLSVREFGTIYEGLLESSLSLAEVDLTLDRDGTWVPAKPGSAVEARAHEPYFHNASGARKASGSYFTPSFLVDHLVEQALVPALTRHLEEVKELLDRSDEPEAARRFFDFRVGDLAMGSGHFLISAIDHIEAQMSRFLETHPIADVSEELRGLQRAALEALGELALDIEIEPSSLLRRQIAKRCIYGLDINQIAVELARVGIWIHTFVPGLAMSSLEHGLVHGNSLTGVGTVEEALRELDPPRSNGRTYDSSLFRDEIEDSLGKAAGLLIKAAQASEATSRDVAQATEVARQAREIAEPTKALFDAAVAIRVGLSSSSSVASSEGRRRLAESAEFKAAIGALKPAHMPYLFPEVFLRDNGGFDVLLGNPPWEKLKVEEHSWWGLRIPGLRSMPQAAKNTAIKEMKDARPDLVAGYDKDCQAAYFARKMVAKGPYPGIGSGDIDLYQAFAWRNYQLLRHEGYLGILLPRGALSGSGTRLWRAEILERAQFERVTILANSRNWVFAEVHPQYNVALITIRRVPSQTLSFNGPFTSREAFDAGRDRLLRVKTTDFKSWSDTFVFPSIPDEESNRVFSKLRQHPRFDATDGFAFRLVRELDTSIDKRFYDFDLEHPSGDVAVWTGGSFNLWEPDFGPPYAYAHREEIIPFLEQKLSNQRGNRRSAFCGLNDEQLTPRPWERARIAFRDVARSTDTRTMIACLVPPGVLLVEKAPYLVSRDRDEINEAYVLAVFSSRIFDWYARRFIELKMSFELVNPMPIPRPARNDPLRLRAIEIAGRLAAVDHRFKSWADAAGVPVGSVADSREKQSLIAELDAVVAHLYGLSDTEVRYIFATFHAGWNFEPDLERTLEYFWKWQGRRS
ncbi:hypothetical protein [Ferrimicrobium sp.]|uniref:Eco57I restriction-modification methylase domain-containing protein n=1 Tax=Ferrimicrobium sp. TaxID=2926050 RepID=UPI0026336014|nr:hypothetical protein [Ferrimicrobium sp.]